MAIIRLPVTGDWIEATLIVGVTAYGNEEDGMGVVTVWVTDFSEKGTGLQTFQHIEVSSLGRAEEVRDSIAVLAGLDQAANVSGFDPNDPDRGSGRGDGDGDDGDVPPSAALKASPHQMLRYLKSWDPDPSASN